MEKTAIWVILQVLTACSYHPMVTEKNEESNSKEMLLQFPQQKHR